MYKYNNYKKYKDEFFQTDYGKNLKARLNRLIIIGILGILFSLYLIIWHTTKWDIVSGVILIFASLFFIIESISLRISKTNEFILKKK